MLLSSTPMQLRSHLPRRCWKNWPARQDAGPVDVAGVAIVAAESVGSVVVGGGDGSGVVGGGVGVAVVPLCMVVSVAAVVTTPVGSGAVGGGGGEVDVVPS